MLKREGTRPEYLITGVEDQIPGINNVLNNNETALTAYNVIMGSIQRNHARATYSGIDSIQKMSPHRIYTNNNILAYVALGALNDGSILKQLDITKRGLIDGEYQEMELITIYDVRIVGVNIQFHAEQMDISGFESNKHYMISFIGSYFSKQMKTGKTPNDMIVSSEFDKGGSGFLSVNENE